MEQLELTLGLAGFVTVAGQCVLSDYIQSDGRFIKEIDDPAGTANSPAIQIISAPVMCNQDALDTPDVDSLSNLPRCVV